MWVHFETIHVDMLPTYMSMYFPGQALMLAAGKVLLGNPWFGVLVSGALMCAGLCWMLQAWLPPGWALLGRHDCGPAPRSFQLLDEQLYRRRFHCGIWRSAGVGRPPATQKDGSVSIRSSDGNWNCLLVLTRPYEGMLLCLPVAVVLGRWVFRARTGHPQQVLIRRAALPLALVACVPSRGLGITIIVPSVAL